MGHALSLDLRLGQPWSSQPILGKGNPQLGRLLHKTSSASIPQNIEVQILTQAQFPYTASSTE